MKASAGASDMVLLDAAGIAGRNPMLPPVPDGRLSAGYGVISDIRSGAVAELFEVAAGVRYPAADDGEAAAQAAWICPLS